MHHEYKSLFFRALRSAIFIMVKLDVDDVKEVLESKHGTSWDQKMAFDFAYIGRQVSRTVPPPKILLYRMRAVYYFSRTRLTPPME